MIVVDTSILIGHLRGDAKATRLLAAEARRGEVLVPTFCAWELWKGAVTSREREAVARFLAGVHVEPFSADLARIAGTLHVQHRQAGVERPTIDLIIAAHAVARGVPVATLDRDYGGVAGLDTVRP